ncbi:MAG: ectoine hydroxylase [Porticoccaceae bacterium]
MNHPAEKIDELSEDLYPSRSGAQPRFIERLDPVIYSAPDSPDSPLPTEQLKHYREQGFLVLEDLFSAEEIAGYQREMADLRANPAVSRAEETITEISSGDVRSIFRVHRFSALFARLAADERLVGIARHLLGDEVYIHQSRLNYKPGFRGKEFYWHSDFETWHVEDGMPRMRALSMFITLTENHDCNGSLMLIPGSHQRYVVCSGQTPENHFKTSLKKQEYGTPGDSCLAELVDKGGIVTVTGKPGSVIIFDCNLMHGSNSNITPYPRSNLFFVYNALSNQVGKPFCNQRPRPEYVCARKGIRPLRGDLCDGA